MTAIKKYLINRWQYLKDNFLQIFVTILFIKLGAWYVVPHLRGEKQPPNPTKIVDLCIKTYKDSGLTGLKILSTKSYSELNKKPTIQDLEKVAIIDMFSYQLDRSMAMYAGFPEDEYFSVNEFHGRIGIYLKSMDLTTEEINKYVRKWEASVNKEITERFK